MLEHADRMSKWDIYCMPQYKPEGACCISSSAGLDWDAESHTRLMQRSNGISLYSRDYYSCLCTTHSTFIFATKMPNIKILLLVVSLFMLFDQTFQMVLGVTTYSNHAMMAPIHKAKKY